MKVIFYTALATTLCFASCQKNDLKNITKPTSELVNLKSIAQTKNLFSSKGITATWDNDALGSIEQIDVGAKIIIADIGRKSRNCFGIGICEWFPKPVGQLLSEGLSENQIILPIIGLEHDKDIVIVSNSPEEDFIVEDDLVLDNARIAKGTYPYDEAIHGHKLHVTVK